MWWFPHQSFFRACPSHNRAFGPVRLLIRVLRLLDLADDEFKSLGDIFVVPRTGLGPGTIIFLGQLLAVLDRNLTLLWPQIALVAHDNHGNPVRALASISYVPTNGDIAATHQVVQDLVANDLDHFKGLRRSYRVNQHVAVDTDEVLRIKNAVFILHDVGASAQARGHPWEAG